MSTIGHGTFGTVYLRNGFAVKRFGELSHLIQEYMAYRRLKGSPNIVNLVDVDFINKELTLELCQTTVYRWMTKCAREGKLPSDSQLMDIVFGSLRGLVMIHINNLVHGDFKPDNILMDIDSVDGYLHIFLTDLGFTCIEGYAKCQQTAAIYRDPKPKLDQSHDMYGFGILLLELFGRFRLKEQLGYSSIKELALTKIKNKVIKYLILRLCQPNHNARPTSLEVFVELFPQDYQDLQLNGSSELTPFVDEKTVVNVSRNKLHELANQLKMSAEHYGFTEKLLLRGFRALALHLSRYGISPVDYRTYGLALLVIVSSMFYTGSFRLEYAADYADCEEETVLDVISNLVKDQVLIETVLTPL